jgi:exosortase K
MTKLCVMSVALLSIWGMKRHYADAGADELWWILTPTARLVGVMSDTVFTMEPGQGYLSRERLFLIEKSCAGINFMIAAFGMLTFALGRRIRCHMTGVCVLGVSLFASYSAAVLVNVVRITIAMWIADHPLAFSRLTAAQLHRTEGIVVYFGGLVLLYELAQRFDRGVAAVGNRP